MSDVLYKFLPAEFALEAGGFNCSVGCKPD